MKDKLRKLLLDAKAICEKAEAEEREFTAEEREQVAKLMADAAEVKKKIAQAEADADVMRQIAEMGKGLEVATPAAPNGIGGGKGTMGERFVNSAEFKAWMQQIAPAGHIPEKARGLQSPPVEFKALMKELLTGVSDFHAGAFVETDYTRIYEPLGRYPLNIFDLISRRTTTSDLVHFVQQMTQVQEAAAVPEANVTDFSGATGEISGEKPEGTVQFYPQTVPVECIAVWIPATKRALADASQLRGLIDQELRADVAEELEDQIINGTGVGGQLTGLANTAGTLLQAWNVDLLTTTRQAVTTLEVTGRAKATAWVIHPQDWETVDLLQDTTGRYYWEGPRSSGPPRLWGIPVVTSQTVTQGAGWLGDWRKMVLWDREAATISVSDSHADFFIRNMVAILCELRAALGVIRPSAFIQVAWESGS